MTQDENTRAITALTAIIAEVIGAERIAQASVNIGDEHRSTLELMGLKVGDGLAALLPDDEQPALSFE